MEALLTIGRENEVKLLAVTPDQIEGLPGDLAAAGREVVAEGDGVHEDVYVDTEDRRLLRAGFSLRYRYAGDAVLVTFKEVPRSRKRPLLRSRAEIECLSTAPTQPGETVPPQIGQHVDPLVGSAPLRPLARVRTRRSRYRLIASADERAHLCCDHVEILPPAGGEAIAAFIEVEIEDDGLGSDVLETIARELIRTRGLSPSVSSKLERALAAFDDPAVPEGSQSGVDLKVRGGDRYADAAYKVFRRHFDRLQANEPGARIGEDPEYVHDMRVATRRLRAAFRTFRPAFGKDRFKGYRQELRHIAGALGTVRDIDVFLEALPDYVATLPETDEGALAPLEQHLKGEREQARVRLLRFLDSRRYQTFLDRFERFLERGPPRHPAQPAADSKVKDVAPKRIRKALRAVLNQGRSMGATPTARDLHELRILCKKLRYTAEPFRRVYGKGMRQFVKRVVALQEVLGDHQDACMAEAALRRFAESLGPRKQDRLRTTLALGELVSAQHRAAEEARARFRKAWSAFDRKRFRKEMWR